MAVRSVRKRRRLTRPERKEQTRGDLLAAAREVFERHGFHRASLEQIAEAAGYTKGAVYSHFPGGKDELFLAVLDRHIDELAARHGVTWTIPTMEVVRGSSALARGMGLERLVDPDAPLGATFEEMFVAQMTALARTDPHRAARVVKEKR